MTLLFAFLTSTWGRALAGVAVVLVLLGSAYLKGRWDASYACETRWKAVVAAEQARQVKANTEAKEAERKRIAAINAKTKQLEDLIDVLNKEADADPRAGECGLGADGVRRLQRIN